MKPNRDTFLLYIYIYIYFFFFYFKWRNPISQPFDCEGQTKYSVPYILGIS